MKILSHRGYWKSPEEKNQAEAFNRSFDLQFGTETDIRDHGGKIVISHDMPNGSEMPLEECLALLAGRNLPLALNVKADGMALLLKDLLQKYNLQNYFVFDMSIPDTFSYINAGLNVFARVSEYELLPVCYDQLKGIWLDAFQSIWYPVELIKEFLSAGKSVCLVSPELHQREPLTLWSLIKEAGLQEEQALMLCTDFPEDAQIFFNER